MFSSLSESLSVILSSILKAAFVLMILGLVLYLAFFVMELSGAYSEEMIVEGIPMDDFVSGMLEDSYVYSDNAILKNLPILKFVVPYISYILAIVSGNPGSVLPELTQEAMISLLVLSLVNAIVLLPFMRLFDSFLERLNNRARIGKSSIIHWFSRLVVTVIDVIYRILLVCGLVSASSMIAYSVVFLLVDMPYAIKVVSIIVLTLAVCFVSAFLHKKLILNGKRASVFGLFLEFSKNIFVDLLFTVLSLFLFGSIFIMGTYGTTIGVTQFLWLFVCSMVDLFLIFLGVRLYAK